MFLETVITWNLIHVPAFLS